MTLLDTLPIELCNYILWLSSGAINVDIYNKKKSINEELTHYKKVRTDYDRTNIWYDYNCDKYGKDGIYLNSIDDYTRVPELASKKQILAHVERFPHKLLRYFKNLKR